MISLYAYFAHTQIYHQNESCSLLGILTPSLLLFLPPIFATNGTKKKGQPSGRKTSSQENPKVTDTLDLDHIPLADQFFKIVDT